MIHSPAQLQTGRLILSVDVEDWPQSTFDPRLPIFDRAERNTHLVLDVLARHDRKATMFVLGLFAERFPDVVRRCANEGHEIASHGYAHSDIFDQTPDEFRNDVRRTKSLLEDLTGHMVNGYRAPNFSVVNSTLWALDVLAEEGYRYDSSVFPVKTRRYGIPDWPVSPVWVVTRSGLPLLELPPATFEWAGRRWPIAGGGYHRLLPWPAIRALVQHVLNAPRPFVAYCHPYEFDPTEMRELTVRVPIKTRVHQGLGRAGFQSKFERLLQSFGGVTAAVMLSSAGAAPGV